MSVYSSSEEEPVFRCPRCEGTGKVKIGKGDDQREVDCSVCGGAGRVTASRMAASHASSDSAEPSQSNKTSDENQETSEGFDPSILNLAPDRHPQSEVVEDILKSSSSLPPDVDSEYIKELLEERAVPCPRCNASKKTMIKGRREICNLCRGLGVVGNGEAQEWRGAMSDNDSSNRFKPE